jgi:hypothetical protein
MRAKSWAADACIRSNDLRDSPSGGIRNAERFAPNLQHEAPMWWQSTPLREILDGASGTVAVTSLRRRFADADVDELKDRSERRVTLLELDADAVENVRNGRFQVRQGRIARFASWQFPLLKYVVDEAQQFLNFNLRTSRVEHRRIRAGHYDAVVARRVEGPLGNQLVESPRCFLDRLRPVSIFVKLRALKASATGKRVILPDVLDEFLNRSRCIGP